MVSAEFTLTTTRAQEDDVAQKHNLEPGLVSELLRFRYAATCPKASDCELYMNMVKPVDVTEFATGVSDQPETETAIGCSIQECPAPQIIRMFGEAMKNAFK